MQAAAAPQSAPHQQQHHAPPVDPKQAATAPEDKVSEKAKLVFAQCWRRLEEKWHSVSSQWLISDNNKFKQTFLAQDAASSLHHATPYLMLTNVVMCAVQAAL